MTAPRGLAAPPETLDDDPPVTALMQRLEPVEVTGTTRVATALHRLRELGADHLIVRTGDRVGAVSELDLRRHVGTGLLTDPVSAVAVPLAPVGCDRRRSAAAALLLDGGRPALVVVAADGSPCGVLDVRAVLRSVAGRR